MMTKDGVPSVNPTLDNMCEMLKTIHDLNERNKMLEVQLTKAKEYIKLLLMNCVGVYRSTGKTVAEIQAEAEAFLKEVEK